MRLRVLTLAGLCLLATIGCGTGISGSDPSPLVAPAPDDLYPGPDGGRSAALPNEAPPAPLPIETPSQHVVRFHFPAAASGYLITQGDRCESMQIAPIGGKPLTLEVPYQCLCGCPEPGPAGPKAARALSSGPLVVQWDARSVTSYTTPVDCSTQGWPGLGTQDAIKGVYQPVAAGLYRATFSFLESVPAGCRKIGDGGDGDLRCGGSGGGPGAAGADTRGYGQLCVGSRTVSVDFRLPNKGDVDVDVDPSL